MKKLSTLNAELFLNVQIEEIELVKERIQKIMSKNQALGIGKLRKKALKNLMIKM